MKNIETFPLNSGIEKIVNSISEKIKKENKKVFVVLVAGGTASGKTSAVAKKIKDFFSDSQILSMDNYYRGKEYYEEHKLNFDQPEALDLELFFKHLEILKSGKSVKIPEYDFKNSKPIYDKIEIKPSKIIIVEGLFSLNKIISPLGDYKIFVDLGVHSQILRRLFRDVDRTGDKPKNILKYFLDVVWEMHKKYIEPTKTEADIVLVNDYTPNLESKNAKIKEERVKYKISITNIKEKLGEIIYKLGGTYVGKMEQTDYFFDPNGQYKNTGELLIIRRTGFDRYFFMYFGPDDEKTKFDDRYTMKFFTDYNTLVKFKSIYEKNYIEVSKLRRSFYLSGVLVCLDEIEGGDTYLTFKFGGKDKREVMLEVLENLGIPPLSGINKTYFQLLN
ncbi:hypothetical protein DLH72_02650 [Candidatus Gracilibacteria bacterium]|nr:MAG: hypothetical protein DLH72_02650 [Candidatus Gracilibacteria bacterium]